MTRHNSFEFITIISLNLSFLSKIHTAHFSCAVEITDGMLADEKNAVFKVCV